MSQASNLLMLFDNAADRASIVASSEAEDLVASNLQNHQRSVVWRSAAAGPQWIDIELSAEPWPVSVVALVDHNLGPDGVVRVQCWSDAVNGSDLVADVQVQPWASLMGYGSGPFGGGTYGGAAPAEFRQAFAPITFIPLPDYVGAQHWRVTLSDPHASYLQLGRLFIGRGWQPEINANQGWQIAYEDTTEFLESRGGQRYGNPKSPLRVLSAQLDWLSPAERTELQLYQSLLGDHTPFITVVRPGETTDRILTSLYGAFQDRSVAAGIHGVYQTPINIKEVR